MKRLFSIVTWVLATIVAGALWFILVGLIGFGVSVLTRSGIQHETTKVWAAVIYIGWAILIILSIVLWRRWNFRCQACKRWGALKLLQTELAKQEKISVLVEVERRDYGGNVIGTQDQYIPGKRKTYQYTYRCKHCNNMETRTRSFDNANI